MGSFTGADFKGITYLMSDLSSFGITNFLRREMSDLEMSEGMDYLSHINGFFI